MTKDKITITKEEYDKLKMCEQWVYNAVCSYVAAEFITKEMKDRINETYEKMKAKDSTKTPGETCTGSDP